MDPAGVALHVAVIPAAVAVAALLLLRRVNRGGIGLAVAAGFVAGLLGIYGIPKGPPAEASHWLLPVAIAGAVLAAVESWARPAVRLVWALRAALFVSAVWVSVLDRTLPWVAGPAAAMLVIAWALDRPEDGAGAAAILAPILLVATATAVALAVSGTMVLGQVCAAFAAATGACLVLAWRFPSSARGAGPLAAALLGAFWLIGVVFSEMTPATAALLASAPLGARIADALLAARVSKGALAAARAVAVAAIAGAAVAVAIASAPTLDY